MSKYSARPHAASAPMPLYVLECLRPQPPRGRASAAAQDAAGKGAGVLALFHRPASR